MTFYTKLRAIGLQFLKFGVVGVLNTVIDFGLLNLLHFKLGAPVLLANTISFSCAMTNSFLMNKHWTFRNKAENIRGQFVQFAVVSIVGLGLNNAILYLGLSVMGTPTPLILNIAKLAAGLIVMAWNFVAYKRLVFA